MSVCVAHANVHLRMGILLQVREVPEDVHRTLKARAASSGLSLSEYVRCVLARTAARPTPSELAARVRARGATEPGEPTEVTVRSLRDHGE